MKQNKISLIAEIGWNHMGDMNLAGKMIQSASENGADFCKFQTWSEKKLQQGDWDHDGRREIYKKAQLTEDQHYELFQVCKKNNVKFLTSIFNIEDISFLYKLNREIIKIPSHEIGNYELINKAVEMFDHVLISTGASKWNEVKKISDQMNMDKITLMHCVSSYPCDFKNINIQRLVKLKEISKNIGYSGHLFGIEDANAAITLGANYIEKHFTIDRDLPGRDNKFALLPEDFKLISKYRDNFLDMNIFHGLDLQDCELDTYTNYRGRWSKK
tara:strand:+ start:9692 stop:10507 length:816 start_codon:yes stop_codon:yes gene_type:complete